MTADIVYINPPVPKECPQCNVGILPLKMFIYSSGIPHVSYCPSCGKMWHRVVDDNLDELKDWMLNRARDEEKL
jgi:hypothetical protein